MRARLSVIQLFQIGSQMSSKSSEAYQCPTPQHSPSKQNTKVVFALLVEQCESGQQHQQTPLISAFVFCVLNKALIRLKCEPPLGFWVRSHHCLCHHLL